MVYIIRVQPIEKLGSRYRHHEAVTIYGEGQCAQTAFERARAFWALKYPHKSHLAQLPVALGTVLTADSWDELFGQLDQSDGLEFVQNILKEAEPF